MATKKRTRANSHTTKTTRSKRASSSAEKKASPKKRAATRSKTKSTTGKTIRKKSTGSKSTKARSSTRKETVSKASSEQRTGTQKKGKSPSDKVVTIDRRCPLSPKDFGLDKALSQSEKPGLERRKKVQRRRQIDPTTCERDYSMNEIEFMSAMDEYKRKSGRSFPTCSEVLEVIQSLGYSKQPSQELAVAPGGQETLN